VNKDRAIVDHGCSRVEGRNDQRCPSTRLHNSPRLSRSEDQAIGDVIKNLTTVLDTTVKHQKQFDGDGRQFRNADHGAEEPRRPLWPTPWRTSVTRRGPSPTCSTPTGPSFKAPSATWKPFQGTTCRQNATTSTKVLTRIAGRAEDHRSRRVASTAISSTSTCVIALAQGQRSAARRAGFERSSSHRQPSGQVHSTMKADNKKADPYRPDGCRPGGSGHRRGPKVFASVPMLFRQSQAITHSSVTPVG